MSDFGFRFVQEEYIARLEGVDLLTPIVQAAADYAEDAAASAVVAQAAIDGLFPPPVGVRLLLPWPTTGVLVADEKLQGHALDGPIVLGNEVTGGCHAVSSGDGNPANTTYRFTIMDRGMPIAFVYYDFGAPTPRMELIPGRQERGLGGVEPWIWAQADTYQDLTLRGAGFAIRYYAAA